MEGKDANQLMKDLTFHFRNLLLIKMNVETDEILTLSDERLKQFKKQSELFNINQISSFIYTLSDIESKLKYSSQPKILMEIAVASLCNRELNDSLEGIIERVKHLEKIIASKEIKVSEDHKDTPHHKPNEKTEVIKPSNDNKKTESRKCENKEIESEKTHKKEHKEYDCRKPEKEKFINTKHPVEDTVKKAVQNKSDNALSIDMIKDVWKQVLDEIAKDRKVLIGALLRGL